MLVFSLTGLNESRNRFLIDPGSKYKNPHLSSHKLLIFSFRKQKRAEASSHTGNCAHISLSGLNESRNRFLIDPGSKYKNPHFSSHKLLIFRFRKQKRAEAWSHTGNRAHISLTGLNESRNRFLIDPGSKYKNTHFSSDILLIFSFRKQKRAEAWSHTGNRAHISLTDLNESRNRFLIDPGSKYKNPHFSSHKLLIFSFRKQKRAEAWSHTGNCARISLTGLNESRNRFLIDPGSKYKKSAF